MEAVTHASLDGLDAFGSVNLSEHVDVCAKVSEVVLVRVVANGVAVCEEGFGEG